MLRTGEVRRFELILGIFAEHGFVALYEVEASGDFDFVDVFEDEVGDTKVERSIMDHLRLNRARTTVQS